MNIKTICITWVALLLVSCSSDEVSPSPDIGSAEASVFGLWNLSSTTTKEDDTRAYYEFSENEWIYYFHQGNSGSDSQNCYLIERETIVFISEDTFITPDREDSGESNIQASTDTLTISYVDTFDDDDDGDTEETIVETFPRVDNISSVDLNECA